VVGLTFTFPTSSKLPGATEFKAPPEGTYRVNPMLHKNLPVDFELGSMEFGMHHWYRDVFSLSSFKMKDRGGETKCNIVSKDV
jgi:hypothetical protein